MRNAFSTRERLDSANLYMTDGKITYDGKTWASNTDNNVWGPGVYGWDKI